MRGEPNATPYQIPITEQNRLVELFLSKRLKKNVLRQTSDNSCMRYTLVDKKFPILSSLLQTPENEAVICFREIIGMFLIDVSPPTRKTGVSQLRTFVHLLMLLRLGG